MNKNGKMFVQYRLYLLIGIFLCIAVSVQAQSQCSGPAIFGSAACFGDDVSTEERELFEAVNSFRGENGKSRLRLSQSLSRLGNRRMLDLTQNMRSLTHSWSNCAYEISNEKTWTCMMDAPVRLKSGYKGRGYETLYATGSRKVEPNAAVAAWKKSPLHSSIILGTGMFASMDWDEFGVAVSGGYATLWFGHPDSSSQDGVVSGTAHRSALEDIQQSFNGIGGGVRNGAAWAAKSGNLTIEIVDATVDFYSTNIRIFLTPAGGAVDPKLQDDVGRFLRLKNPEWPEAGAWLSASIAEALQRNGGRRVKLTTKSAIEVSRDAGGRVLISIYPNTRARARDDF